MNNPKAMLLRTYHLGLVQAYPDAKDVVVDGDKGVPTAVVVVPNRRKGLRVFLMRHYEITHTQRVRDMHEARDVAEKHQWQR